MAESFMKKPQFLNYGFRIDMQSLFERGFNEINFFNQEIGWRTKSFLFRYVNVLCYSDCKCPNL